MFPLSAVLLAAAAAPADQIKLLNIGDPAPQLKVARWVKGEPVEAFEKGQVYVVEFWATWCGPCRESIPRLTELARKHQGKVTVIGVSILERGDKDEDDVDRVAKFVKGMGDRMGYRVAADGSANFMARNWFTPSVEEGIPLAFIVGGDGTIAWIGHPLELEKVLGRLLDGNLDSKALAKTRRREKTLVLVGRKLNEFVQADKLPEAVQAIDAAVAADPDFKKALALPRFRILLRFDEAGAYAYARQLTEGDLKNEARFLAEVAMTVVETPKLRKPDFDLALACAQKASQLTQAREPMVQAILAMAHFKKGNPARAAELMEKAVEEMESIPQFPAELKQAFAKKLDAYKEAAKPPAKK